MLLYSTNDFKTPEGSTAKMFFESFESYSIHQMEVCLSALLLKKDESYPLMSQLFFRRLLAEPKLGLLKILYRLFCTKPACIMFSPISAQQPEMPAEDSLVISKTGYLLL